MSKENYLHDLKDITYALCRHPDNMTYHLDVYRLKRRYQRKIDGLKELIEERFKLEKALDKACSRLEEMDKALNVYDHLAYWDAEEWKEWCLKDD